MYLYKQKGQQCNDQKKCVFTFWDTHIILLLLNCKSLENMIKVEAHINTKLDNQLIYKLHIIFASICNFANL
jgi:hypothetical protein